MTGMGTSLHEQRGPSGTMRVVWKLVAIAAVIGALLAIVFGFYVAIRMAIALSAD
jgi:hypothetical protein